MRINNLLVQAREISLFQLPHAKWAYIPRECNGTADHLAGLASQLVQTARDEDTADYLAPFSPLNCSSLQLVHVTGQTAAAWSVDHTAPFVLPELSDASSWHAVALLQRYFPEDTQSLASLYAIALRTPRDVPHLVQYAPRTRPDHYPYGRSYPTSPGGAKLKKAARHILFGRTHVEYDLRGSFFGIFLALLQRVAPDTATGPFTSVASTRDFLDQQLHESRYAARHPDFAKGIPILCLTTEVHVVVSWLVEWNFGITPELRQFFDSVHQYKGIILRDFSHEWDDPRVNDKNRLYFILEHHEARFLRAFARHVLLNSELQSVIWLHDGIWVYPDVQPHIVQQAEYNAIRDTNLQVSVVKTCLRERHDQYMHKIRGLPVTGPYEPRHHVILRQLAQLEWWQHVHERPGALPVAVTRQIRHVAQQAQIDHASSLHKFFERARKQIGIM